MPAPIRSAAVSAGKPFSWRYTTPLFLGSALNPINSSLIATGLLRNCDEPQQGSERGLLSDGWARHAPRVVGDAANGEVRDVRPWNGDSA